MTSAVNSGNATGGKETTRSVAAVSQQVNKAVGQTPRLPKSNSTEDLCDKCGRSAHSVCFFEKHPDRNHESKPFLSSSKGIAYKAKFSVNHLLAKKILSGDSGEVEKFVKLYDAHVSGLKGGKSLLLSHLSRNDSLPTTNASLIFGRKRVKITLGFDSHAQGDFMSQRLADTFSNRADRLGGNARICSAFNECINLEGLLPFELSFINERHIKVTISMKVFIAPIPYDLLMGISSMRVHHIVSQHFPKLFDDQSDIL